MKNKPKGIIFDLDGTIYTGEKLLPGAKQTVAWLKENDFSVIFISNKPLESNLTYSRKLSKLGIPTTSNEIINSTNALIYYLKEHFPNARLFPIGESPFCNELAKFFELSENPNNIDVVIASFDRGFNYKKLNIGFQAIKNGAKFFATNADPTCPVPNGEIPDAGAIIGALEGCSNKKVEFVAGKPSKLIINLSLDRLNTTPEKCILIGDRLSTDIRMGKESKIKTVLVLSGVTSKNDIAKSSIKPDYVIDNLLYLPQLIKKGLF